MNSRNFIKERRLELNMSQEELARKLGVCRQTINHIERCDDWRIGLLDALRLVIIRRGETIKTLEDYSTDDLIKEIVKRSLT